jgi:hypothetical protein
MTQTETIDKNLSDPDVEKAEHIKRINISLSDRAYLDLQAASRDNRRSMTDIVRLSLGLVKILMEAQNKGYRMYVTTPDGEAVKEIVLPG